VAHLDAAVVQKVLDIPKREPETDILIMASRMISGLVRKQRKGLR
jgi:hypothetical protein